MSISFFFSSLTAVAPREGRVSRNEFILDQPAILMVAPREGRVSRNGDVDYSFNWRGESRPARGV